MRIRLAAIAGTLALASSPAAASPPPNHAHGMPPNDHGTVHKPAGPGPRAGLPATGKAYGRYCRGESKKHVKGMKGTPFSQCVTAMAKLAKGETKSPHSSCTSEPKTHVEGHKGTPYSLCVAGGARLLEDQHGESDS
jgi:hypothetical protein